MIHAPELEKRLATEICPVGVKTHLREADANL